MNTTNRSQKTTIHDVDNHEMDMWRSLIDVPVYVILSAIAITGKLSQKEIADTLGCNKKTINHWLTGGRTPGLGYKALIDVHAYILGIDVEFCRHVVRIAKLEKTLSLPEAIDELLEIGETYRSIAETVGSYHRSVFYWHKHGTPTSMFRSLKIYALYYEQNLMFADVMAYV